MCQRLGLSTLFYRGSTKPAGQRCAYSSYGYLEESLQQTPLPGLPVQPCSCHLSSLLGSGMEAEAEAASRHSWLPGNKLFREFKFCWQQLEICFWRFSRSNSTVSPSPFPKQALKRIKQDIYKLHLWKIKKTYAGYTAQLLKCIIIFPSVYSTSKLCQQYSFKTPEFTTSQ